jgi:hypothetical protein
MYVLSNIIHTLERYMYSTPESPTIKHCAQCGVQFTPHKLVGQRQRFCCDACRTAWKIANERAAITCTCKHCGVEFQPKKRNRNQFCSRACAYAFGHPDKRKPKPEPKPLSKCEICGKEVASAWAKTCSAECAVERNRRKSQQWFESKSQRDRSPRACKECGTVFAPIYGDLRKSFCCRRCARAWGKRRSGKPNGTFNHVARKRLRVMFGDAWRDHYEPISKRKVFERDRWRCQLCGAKLKRTKQWYPGQASIDHIVPLAFGGDHKYANVQACCMECNSKKGATVQGQQRLIG